MPAVSGSNSARGDVRLRGPHRSRRDRSRRALSLIALLSVTVAFCGCPCGRNADDPTAVDDDDDDAKVDPLRAARAKAFPKPTGEKGARVYAPHRDVLATVFWVGEPPTAQNGCMANFASAFDHDWLGAYGGCDAASPRVTDATGWSRPGGFVPRENPYYFALPYGTNERAPWRDEIPWVDDRPLATSVRQMVKNRWIAVRAEPQGDRTCYAQWEDVGPFCADDAEYVFGHRAPRNDGKRCDTEAKGNGIQSALDMSPALSLCLGHEASDMFRVEWWFVDDAQVPQGPWKRVVTTSPVRDGPPRAAGKCVEHPPYPACPP